MYGQSGDPATKLNALMTRLDTTPMRVGGRQLTRSLALTGVLQTLYDQSLWTYLDQGLTGADRGNGAILLYFADAYLQRHADGTYGNLWNGAYDASFCLDFYSPPDIAAYDALGPSYTKASPVFGPWSQYSNLQCGLWPVKVKASPDPLPIKDAPPILLVGGTNDPATPYQDAMNVFHKVDGAVLLTREGNGHVSYGSSECSHTYEDDYLINLTLPQPGTVCST